MTSEVVAAASETLARKVLQEVPVPTVEEAEAVDRKLLVQLTSEAHPYGVVEVAEVVPIRPTLAQAALLSSAVLAAQEALMLTQALQAHSLEAVEAVQSLVTQAQVR
jgi:hypothetical protein